MAIIVDPDSLTYGSGSSTTACVLIDTTTKTIGLVAGKGSLTTDGVTGDCLYSFLKECWHTDANALNLVAYPFPMNSITNEQFEFWNGWKPKDDATRKLIRTAGWAEYDSTGTYVARKYASIVTLGSIGAGEYVYYQQSADGEPTNFTYSGAVNEAVQYYGNITYDSTTTTFDYSTYFKVFIRIQGKSYGDYQLNDIGVPTMSTIVYRFPLSDDSDTKITASDITISTAAPYTGITVTYYASNQTRTIGGVEYTFNVVIAGNDSSTTNIYEKIQYLLRQTTDIDTGTGTVTGKTASALLSFVGDTLHTSTGVFIDNLNASYINNVVFTTTTGSSVTYPYTASLTLNFNENLSNDTNAIYRVFFTNDEAATTPLGYNYGTANAITVQDSSAVSMNGSVGGASSKTFTYSYDTNIQRGAGSAAKDAPITVVAIGLSTSQYVKATGTITRSTSNAISLVSSLERNYSNPA